jgi:hypothetical protein
MDNLNMNALQERTSEWVESRGLHLYKPVERGCRFWEEWFEFGQALGIPYEDALRILNKVYSKPVGDIRQEAGGAGMTLLALAQANGFSLGEAIEDELDRVYSLPMERFRKRNRQNAEDGTGAPPEEQ